MILLDFNLVIGFVIHEDQSVVGIIQILHFALVDVRLFHLVAARERDFVDNSGTQIFNLDLDDHLAHRSFVVLNIQNDKNITFIFKCCSWF